MERAVERAMVFHLLERHPMTPLVFRPTRVRVIFPLVTSLAFVAAGVFVLFTRRPDSTAMGWATILFFGGCAAVFVRQLLDARPRLVLNDEGILDRTLKVGVIRWEDILGAEVAAISGQNFVALHLRDASRYTARLGPVYRRLVELNESLGFARLNVNLSMIDVDPYMLAALIVREAETRRSAPSEPYRG
jgi:hypothetical protein